MEETRKRKARSRFEDEEFCLVQFLDDGLRRVIKAIDVEYNGADTTAKFEDGQHYKCVVIDRSDDKESLLKKKQLLEGEKTHARKGPGKRRNGAGPAKSGKQDKGRASKRKSAKGNEDGGDVNGEGGCTSGEEEESVDQSKPEKRKKGNVGKGADGKKKGNKGHGKGAKANGEEGCTSDAEEISSKKKKSKEEQERRREQLAKNKKIVSENVERLLEKMTSKDVIADEDRFDENLVASASALLTALPQHSLLGQCGKETPVNSMAIVANTQRQPNETPIHVPRADPDKTRQGQDRIQYRPAPLVRQQLFIESPADSRPSLIGRPSVGGKCPRKQIEKNGECASCIRLKLEIADLQQQLQEIVENKATDRPRPGNLHPLVADRFNMVELTPGSRIFLYEDQIGSAAGKKSATACAAFLLNCFYTNKELIGCNLTGANGKKALDANILDSIINFTLKAFNASASTTESSIKISLRNKLSALKDGDK